MALDASRVERFFVRLAAAHAEERFGAILRSWADDASRTLMRRTDAIIAAPVPGIVSVRSKHSGFGNAPVLGFAPPAPHSAGRVRGRPTLPGASRSACAGVHR